MISLKQQIASQLKSVYPPDEAEALAWWILEETTGLTRTQIITGCKDTTNISNLQEIIDRLLNFEPIQYIFGHTLWNGLDLKVTPATLIPRPETAELVTTISNCFKHYQTISNLRVLDIGTGSGCIAIALKKAHPEWQITGIDLSQDAIRIAKENAIRNDVNINFQAADIFDFNVENHKSHTTNHQYEIVVSNPPYIRECEKKTMRPNVLNFEPHTALFVPDSDPLRFYRHIAALRLGKLLFFEINEVFASEISAILHELGYSDIQTTRDYYGKPRIIQGRMA